MLPFALIYLHNVQGIAPRDGRARARDERRSSRSSSGPVGGVLVDRLGGKAVLASALVFLAIGYAGYVLVDSAWKGFVVATVTGVGNGLFWPAQSTLITVLTPRERRHAAFAMQRVVMNLGIGLGALVGGLIATTSRPGTFDVLFLVERRDLRRLPRGAHAARARADARGVPALGGRRELCAVVLATARSWASSRSTHCSSSPGWPASSCCRSTRRTRRRSPRR